MTAIGNRVGFEVEPSHILDLCKKEIGSQAEPLNMRQGDPIDLGYHPESVLSVLKYLNPRALFSEAVYGREFIAVRVAPANDHRPENARVECIHLYGSSILKEGVAATVEQIRDLFKLARGEIIRGWRKI